MIKWKKDLDRNEALDLIQDIFRDFKNLNLGINHLNHEKLEVRQQAKFEKELAEQAMKADLQRLRYLLEK